MTIFMKNKESTTKKLKTGIFKGFIVSLLIILCSFLPYIHDIGLFDGMEGFSGFSSLRVGVWAVALFLVGLIGWIVAFLNSKNKTYRFAMLAPIFMMSFQLGIYLFDARNTTTNEFSTKIIINILFAVVIVAAYFLGKSSKQ